MTQRKADKRLRKAEKGLMKVCEEQAAGREAEISRPPWRRGRR